MADKIKEHDDYYEIPKNVFTENFVDLYKANMKLTIENKKLKARNKVLELKATPRVPKSIDYNRGNTWGVGMCPACLSVVTTSMNYCDDCGQHIVWQQPKKKGEQDDKK